MYDDIFTMSVYTKKLKKPQMLYKASFKVLKLKNFFSTKFPEANKYGKEQKRLLLLTLFLPRGRKNKENEGNAKDIEKIKNKDKPKIK